MAQTNGVVVTASLTDVLDFLLDRGVVTLAEIHISYRFTC